MTNKTLITVFLVLSSFIILFDTFAKDLPPLPDGQMSYEEAARLAKVYDDVVRRLDEKIPVSQDEINEATLFVGWAKGFAEAIVMSERGNEKQRITECVEKYGYSFIPSEMAAIFLSGQDAKPKPKNYGAQSSAYGALLIGCYLQQ